jgi:hypothetical protein
MGFENTLQCVLANTKYTMKKVLTIKQLWWLLAAILFLLLLLAGNKLRGLLDPEFSRIAEISPQCDLRQKSCKTSLSATEHVLFSITPTTIPLLKPLMLDVQLEGFTANKVMVDIVGLNMDMGYNRPQLTTNNPQHFSGSTSLPICTLDRMEWEARVMIETQDDGNYLIPFRFYTERDT